ncbi:MAG: cation:proton antiporter [Desulfobacterales bacterium]|nr:cation:proton antiporter [Desulfobacterales bacterium]
MDLHDLLFVILIFLAATAICVTIFERLGLGSIVGFIVAGILIGPHTPGPVASTQVDQLHHVSELGIVLFMFVVALELPPKHLWKMRKQLLGLGCSQIVLSTVVLTPILALIFNLKFETALIVGLGLALSSTAVIMTMLTESGQLSTKHGRNIFSILMAQDVAIIPIMALIPLLARVQTEGPEQPLALKVLIVFGALLGIFILGRFALPWLLGLAARKRSKEAFGMLLFLSVLGSAWVADLAGLSLTLGAFLLGMLLAMSEYRYLIEEIVEPIKFILMGLFFVAVGMSIDIQAFFQIWKQVLLLVVVVMAIKAIVLIGLCRLLGSDLATSIRTGFMLCQVGEFAFILYGAAAGAGLILPKGLTIGYLVISVTMILTPIMQKLGERLASRFDHAESVEPTRPAGELHNHLVIVGAGEVGRIAALMAERSEISYIAIDNRVDVVRAAKHAGLNVLFGDIRMEAVTRAANLERARAVFLTTTNKKTLRSISTFLQQIYVGLSIYTQVSTLKDAVELQEKGIQSAGAIYVESTLALGKEVIKEFGVPEDNVEELVKEMQANEYAMIRHALT